MEAVIKRVWCALALLLISFASQAAGAAKDSSVMVYGKADGKAPGWAITTDVPNGWTQDCCLYAKAIGVNLVLYKGDWTGKPERVMVLNVWPAKLATLDAELQEDRKQYLQHDPAGKVSSFAVSNEAKLACQGVLYQGSDHEDDAVVFCDPGKATGVRLSWSMTIAANDVDKQDVLALFKGVVEKSSYMKYEDSTGKPQH